LRFRRNCFPSTTAREWQFQVQNLHLSLTIKK
jgi:hypothetical protein